MRLNMILYAAFALLFLLSFWAMQAQGAVGDKRFIRAMIPHHSGAILMCNRASIRDAEIRDICFKPDGIVDSQTRDRRDESDFETSVAVYAPAQAVNGVLFPVASNAST